MKVSVLVITYNHEKFIAQALDSVLMQETDFIYEIIVGEDCSSDQTRKIVLAYGEKYPDKVRLLLPEQNLGMMYNFITTYRACRGQYIAILEGDDYWTSDRKLQKQVDFLDSHQDCTACFHNVNVVYESDSKKSHPFHHRKLKQYFTLKDVVSRHFIPTCSTMFRRGVFDDFPAWYPSMPMGDWPLHVLHAEKGLIGYIDELLGTYRLHEGGMISAMKGPILFMKTIEAAKIIDQYLNFRFHKYINHLIAGCHYRMAEIFLRDKNYSELNHHAEQALILSPWYNMKIKYGALRAIVVSSWERIH